MRGKINNRERARQIRDYSGLRFGKITPTDIDGLLDFRNKLFVYIEIKLIGAELPYGQKLALERQCDAARKPGSRKTAVLIIEHDTAPEEDIDAASCPVREYRCNGKWGRPTKPITCLAAVEKLMEWANITLDI